MRVATRRATVAEARGANGEARARRRRVRAIRIEGIINHDDDVGSSSGQ